MSEVEGRVFVFPEVKGNTSRRKKNMGLGMFLSCTQKVLSWIPQHPIKLGLMDVTEV